jgi:tRNA threonylcarbamoyl adenosine modification protein YeaZ
VQKILFLDVASHAGAIACVTDDRTVASIAVDHRVSDAELPNLIQSALSKAGWTMKDLTHLACVVGPGGFTSLRVGVAAVNALAYALSIPAAGIHLSDLYAARATSDERRGMSQLVARRPQLLWLHSTKKAALFLRDLSSSEESRLVTVEELPALLKGHASWTGELIPEQRAVVDAAGLAPAALRSLEEVLPGFLKDRSYDSRILEPWYGRGW